MQTIKTDVLFAEPAVESRVVYFLIDQLDFFCYSLLFSLCIIKSHITKRNTKYIQLCRPGGHIHKTFQVIVDLNKIPTKLIVWA